MKKVAILLAVVLIFLPLSAQAATPWTITTRLNVIFNENSANCSAYVLGNSPSDSIRATIKFCRTNTVIETWQVTGIGCINFLDTAPATPGETYNLIIYLTINSTAYQPIYCTKTYE